MAAMRVVVAPESIATDHPHDASRRVLREVDS